MIFWKNRGTYHQSAQHYWVSVQMVMLILCNFLQKNYFCAFLLQLHNPNVEVSKKFIVKFRQWQCTKF